MSATTEYVGEYGEYGYRGVTLWAEAVKKAGSPEPDKVIEALCRGRHQRAGRGWPLHDRRPDQSHDHGYPHRARQPRQVLRRDQVLPAAPAEGHAAGLRPAQESGRHQAIRAGNLTARPAHDPVEREAADPRSGRLQSSLGA